MPGPRVYTLEEADALVPTFERAFDAIDRHRELLRTVKIKLNALEMIWGPALADDTCPDHGEGRALVEQLADAENAIAGEVQGLAERSVLVKDVHSGLVDVYHVREGVLVYLCWKRGEPAITAWHHVDTGFADRQTL